MQSLHDEPPLYVTWSQFVFAILQYLVTSNGTNRPEDGILLGADDEVVFGCSGAEGSLSSGGEAERVAERWCVGLSLPASALYADCMRFDAMSSPDLGLAWLVCVRIALAATGIIWVRYSFVITPVNYSLAAVRVLSRLESSQIHCTCVFRSTSLSVRRVLASSLVSGSE